MSSRFRDTRKRTERLTPPGPRNPPGPRAPRGFRGAFLSGPDIPFEASFASGPLQLVPLGLAAPSDRDDAGRLMEAAAHEGWSLVPRGAGTAMPGSNVGRGILVDLSSSFRDLGSIDRDRGRIRVGSGVTGEELEQAARKSGLRFPPLPSSARWCTVGGMVASNAAGPRSFRFGSVRPWVEEVSGVLADGRPFRLIRGKRPPVSFPQVARPLDSDEVIMRWPGVRKNASGYDLATFARTGDPLDLLVGSEGTLALVTEAVLRLQVAPEARSMLVLSLPDLDALASGISLAGAHGASSCELVGRRLLDLVDLDDHPDLAAVVRGRRGILLLEFEGDGGDGSDARSRMTEATRALRGTGIPFLATADESTIRRLETLRKRASPLIRERARVGVLSTQFIEDSVVPATRLATYIERLEQILEEAETDHVLFGHAGDGNLHVNPLVDVRHPEWRARVRRILDATVDLVAGMGGTLTGEHGDGRLRAPFLDRIYGDPTMGRFRGIKQAFDPSGRLNPGVILPLPDQDPLDGLHAALLWDRPRSRSLESGFAPRSSTLLGEGPGAEGRTPYVGAEP